MPFLQEVGKLLKPNTRTPALIEVLSEIDLVAGDIGLLNVTRSTTAWYETAAGLLAEAAINAAVIEYSDGTLLGLRHEHTAENECLHSRDLTNGVWVNSNTSDAKDQTGADGTANGASSVTATAGNGTILQSITSASADRVFTAYIKRLVGTGTIEMTLDNGASWTDITSSINGSTFTRVEVTGSAVANPQIGFRIAGSGDSIAVDFCHEETGAFATSPIVTAGSKVTRAEDEITADLSSAIKNPVRGVFRIVCSLYSISGTEQRIAVWSGGSNNERIIVRKKPFGNQLNALVTADGATVANLLTSTAVSGVGPHALDLQVQTYPDDMIFDTNGDTDTDTNTSGVVPDIDDITLGEDRLGGFPSQRIYYTTVSYRRGDRLAA